MTAMTKATKPTVSMNLHSFFFGNQDAEFLDGCLEFEDFRRGGGDSWIVVITVEPASISVGILVGSVKLGRQDLSWTCWLLGCRTLRLTTVMGA